MHTVLPGFVGIAHVGEHVIYRKCIYACYAELCLATGGGGGGGPSGPASGPASPPTHPDPPLPPPIGGGGLSVLLQSAGKTKTLCICPKKILSFGHYGIFERVYRRTGSYPSGRSLR